jgi:hypothetical protein
LHPKSVATKAQTSKKKKHDGFFGGETVQQLESP